MSASTNEAQILNQLNLLLDQSRAIRARVDATEMGQIREFIRDQVNRLSREHENIRNDLRDLRNAMSTTSAD